MEFFNLLRTRYKYLEVRSGLLREGSTIQIEKSSLVIYWPCFLHDTRETNLERLLLVVGVEWGELIRLSSQLIRVEQFIPSKVFLIWIAKIAEV